jgi:hypothetical protein
MSCVDTIAQGNVFWFAKACQVSRSALRSHVKGEYRVTIDILLRFCQRLDAPVTTFFETDRSRVLAQWEHAKEALQHDHVRFSIRLSAAEVRRLLVKAAQEQPVVSLSEIAARLGYKGTDRLYQIDGDLCKQIAAKYRRSGRSHLWRKPGAERISEKVELQQLLQQSLAQERPVSPGVIASRLGYANEGYLRQRFPDLCRAIGQKIAAQKAEGIDAMEKTLGDALKEEPAPTLNELRKRLAYSSTESLQFHFPGICKRILARREAYNRARITELRTALENLLSEIPALSLRVASKRVGFSLAYLKELCPQQCAALGSRYVRWRHEAALRRRAQLIDEVRQIVQNIHLRGKCPTVKRVSSLLQPNSLREWKALQGAVKAAREEIGQL